MEFSLMDIVNITLLTKIPSVIMEVLEYGLNPIVIIIPCLKMISLTITGWE